MPSKRHLARKLTRFFRHPLDLGLQVGGPVDGLRAKLKGGALPPGAHVLFRIVSSDAALDEFVTEAELAQLGKFRRFLENIRQVG